MSFLDRFRALPQADLAKRLPFHVDGVAMGYIAPEFAAELAAFPDVFQRTPASIDLHPGLRTHAERTGKVSDVLALLRQKGLIPHWRNETYRVATGFHDLPAFEMERAAAALFGITAYGVHVNGYVRDAGGLALWVGRRSRASAIEPDKLDQIVAGGLPAGLDIEQNLIKEGWEEASIPRDAMARAQPAGTVSYTAEWNGTLRHDVLFVYDLDLPADFKPRNTDGEIAAFYRWPIDEAIARVRDTADFKFNSALVVIDFLIRHGHIGPNEPGYAELVRGLHR